MPNNYKYDTWEDAIDAAIGSAINDNINIDGDISEMYLDDVVKEAIKNIKDTLGLTITFKGEM